MQVTNALPRNGGIELEALCDWQHLLAPNQTEPQLWEKTAIVAGFDLDVTRTKTREPQRKAVVRGEDKDIESQVHVFMNV